MNKIPTSIIIAGSDLSETLERIGSAKHIALQMSGTIAGEHFGTWTTGQF